MKKFIYLFFLLLLTQSMAQVSKRTGAISRINLNQKLNNDWKLNYKIENRVVFFEKFRDATSSSNFQYSLTDLSFLVSKKTGLNNSFAAGYLLRTKEGSNDHRLIQQFAIVSRFNSFRLAHRFVADQTFRKQLDNIYRFRYRASVEIPFNGYSVDKNEFYLKLNNEYLHIFQASDYDLEIRFVPLLGYLFKDSNKLEFGLDYRMNEFITSSSRNVAWITVNWFIAI